MTNLEKWQPKLSEAKDGYELRATLLEMNYSFETTCKTVVGICKGNCDMKTVVDICKGNCDMCFARWLDGEVKENDVS